jgi:3-dehydrotetronate 4-kinase
VGDRPLNESGLEHHPLNPMTDSNIRRWLSLQTKHPVGLVPWSVVNKGGAAIRHALEEAAARGEWLVVVDALQDEDLIAIDEACIDALLLTGGSGIAMGLPKLISSRGFASGRSKPFGGGRGAGAILAGSCSNATLSQINYYRATHPSLEVDVRALMNGQISAESVTKFVSENRGRDPLVYSSAQPDKVRALQREYGDDRVAHGLEQLFAEAARKIVDEGFDRLVVAGGETSGAVVSGLHLPAVTIGPEIDPGVPALAAEGQMPIALALKSGNFGSVDFFAKALRALAAA